MGFYTEKTGGVQVINDQGYFVKSAGSGAYTTQNGSWCFPEDATLYAHWESRVFAVKLLPGSSFTSAGTSTIYEKYGTGWFSDLSATSPIASITPPTRTGYTFEGYFTAPNGAGTKAIGKDNAVPAGKELFTQDTTLYAHWTSVAYRATVTLRLGASAYTGREVGLYQNGALRYTLKQTGASTGVYEHYQSNAAAADFGVVSGVYDVYVDGVATNEKLTVDGKDVQMTINYYLAEVETTLGGTPAQVGSEATLRSDAFGTVTANWDDGLKKYTAPIHPSGPNNVWKIYVDGADTGYTLDMSQTLRRAAAIPYYNATLGLVYDSGWDDAVVTLRQSGAVKYSLPYTTGDTGPGGTVNTYQKAVPGDTGADLYQVFVNGLDTGETLTLIKNSAATWTAAAEYYAAAVTVTRDGAGQPWADTGVTLWRDGAPAYTLGYDSGAGAYREPYARKYATDSYDVRVAGSISGADTGVKVTEAEPDPAIAYFSVTYTDKENLYLRQTVRDGLKATEPSAPYHYGSTFKGWYTEPMPDDNDEPYDFGSEVKGKLELYAGYDEPEVIIGGYVRCDADGTPNGNGGLYYKMANLVVRGFPATGTPIGSLTLTVRNCEVITYSPPGSESGYNVMKNIDADTGNGTVSIVFTGIGGVGTAEVQRFLRTNVIVKIKDTEAEHRMRVSVFGDTN
ncbi:MAG: InlB B-repeat-containing protein [Clostridiales Family XIII bacterium]|nr:InlB B-repeat-containing protein [Clostridiales Family XIII bacterium]